MKISDAILRGREFVSSRLEIEVLLAHVLGQPREVIFAHPKKKISSAAARKFFKLCASRAAGKPISHLTRRKKFYGLDFYVDERVLIPRPETELLVEKVAELVACATSQVTNYKLQAPLICDVGTGCGCIAIVLAKHLKHARFFALDVSEKALAVARKNAKTHKVSGRIKFINSNLLNKVLKQKFTGIVANLPYIAKGDLNVSGEVRRFEPPQALFAGKTGLELYEKLFSQIKKMDHPPVWICVEIGIKQKSFMNKLVKKYFKSAKMEWSRDLAGIARAIVIFL